MTKTPLPNRRLTFILDIIAKEAITANDDIFQERLGYTIRDLRVLRIVDDNPDITFVDICALTGLERSLVSRILQSLIRDGLLSRSSSTEDARKFHLSTTASGKYLRAEGRKLSDALEEILLEPFAPDERKGMFDLLERLGEWVRSGDYKAALDVYRGGKDPA